nr:MAG TPA: hypothetical protein [Caudoviricetes sp.]
MNCGLSVRQTVRRGSSMCWPAALFVNHIPHFFPRIGMFFLSFPPGSPMLAA